MIPFYVVDRPMSLNIIKTFYGALPYSFGLMSHALVSRQFRKLYADFPCAGSCRLCGANPIKVSNLCAAGKKMQKQVVRIVDSGIFHPHKRPDYTHLFDIYEEMNAQYGIMMDVFGDARKTISSAEEAVKTYTSRKYGFELVLVAQGQSPKEYAKCAQSLKELGVGQLAIGGLLRRKVNSVRYASAGTIERIDDILKATREVLPDEWLFVLGCYHPKRHALFERYNIFGSDYKGWIFNYEHRADALNAINAALLAQERKLKAIPGLIKKAKSQAERSRRAQLTRWTYSTTHNVCEQSSVEKAKYRGLLNKQRARVQEIDLELVGERLQYVNDNGLPADYKRLVAEFHRIANLTDQEFRIEGVHKYLAEQVISQMMPAFEGNKERKN